MSRLVSKVFGALFILFFHPKGSHATQISDYKVWKMFFRDSYPLYSYFFFIFRCYKRPLGHSFLLNNAKVSAFLRSHFLDLTHPNLASAFSRSRWCRSPWIVSTFFPNLKPSCSATFSQRLLLFGVRTWQFLLSLRCPSWYSRTFVFSEVTIELLEKFYFQPTRLRKLKALKMSNEFFLTSVSHIAAIGAKLAYNIDQNSGWRTYLKGWNVFWTGSRPCPIKPVFISGHFRLSHMTRPKTRPNPSGTSSAGVFVNIICQFCAYSCNVRDTMASHAEIIVSSRATSMRILKKFRPYSYSWKRLYGRL